MSNISIEAQIAPDQLLKALEQLPLTELDSFVAQILSLRAQRDPSRLSSTEAELLVQINQGLSIDLRQRFDELVNRRQSDTISSDELSELILLTDQIEAFDAQRITYLADLARLRKVSLSELMHYLGIQPATYG